MKSRTLFFPSIVALLCSCAQASPLAGHDPIAVYISSFNSGAVTSAIKEIAEEVVKAKSYPCEVEVHVYDWDTAGFDGNPYDITFGYPNYSPFINPQIDLVPFPKDVYESATKGMDEKTLSHWEKDGKQYSIPVFMQQEEVLYYDSSLISEEDVADWDKLCAAADKIGKKVGFFEVSKSNYNFIQYCYGAGAHTKVTGCQKSASFEKVEDNFNTDAGLNAAKSLIRLLQKPNVVRSYEEAEDMLSSYFFTPSEESGVVAYLGYSFMHDGAEKLYGENFKMARIPKFCGESTQYPSYSRLFAYALSIFQNDTMDEAKKQVCYDIASALASEASQKKLSEPMDHYYHVPTNLKAREELDVDYEPIVAGLDQVVAVPYGGKYSEIVAKLGDAINANVDDYDEANLKAALQAYHDQVMALEGQSFHGSN